MLVHPHADATTKTTLSGWENSSPPQSKGCFDCFDGLWKFFCPKSTAVSLKKPEAEKAANETKYIKIKGDLEKPVYFLDTLIAKNISDEADPEPKINQRQLFQHTLDYFKECEEKLTDRQLETLNDVSNALDLPEYDSKKITAALRKIILCWSDKQKQVEVEYDSISCVYYPNLTSTDHRQGKPTDLIKMFLYLAKQYNSPIPQKYAQLVEFLQILKHLENPEQKPLRSILDDGFTDGSDTRNTRFCVGVVPEIEGERRPSDKVHLHCLQQIGAVSSMKTVLVLINLMIYPPLITSL